MLARRFQMSARILSTLSILLVSMVTAADAQSQAPQGKAKVDRLVMGLILPYRDYIRPWIVGTPDHNIQHDPAFEWLFEVDVESGKYNLWLAESAEMAKDSRSWRQEHSVILTLLVVAADDARIRD